MSMLTALYVPASRPDRFDKALSCGADAVVVDLEDAVAPRDKQTARENTTDWLATLRPGGATVWVRVNNDRDLLDDDLSAVADMPIAGVWIPKIERPEELAYVDEVLGAVEQRPLAVSPLIETGAGLLEVAAIARAPRVTFLQIGEHDLIADLGLEPGPDGWELLHPRSTITTASAAAGLVPPMAAVSTETRNLAAFAEETRRLRRLGFWGRACIHPSQLAPAAAAFRPTDAELAWAEEILDVMTEGAVGRSASGHLVDEAVARRARRLLAAVDGHEGLDTPPSPATDPA